MATRSSVESQQYPAVSGVPLSILLTDVDVGDLGDKFGLFLDNAYRDALAKAAVKLCHENVNNYTTIIENFIRDHKRGSPSTTNVTGVLFYLLSKKGDMTLQEVKILVVKVDGAQAGKVDEAIRMVLGDTRHDTKPHLPEAEQSAPAAPAPTAGAAPPAQRTDPVPAWSSRPIADMNNKKIVGGKLTNYLVNQEKDTVAREVVRLIDEVQADTAATILIDYCRENPEVIVSAGHYNMTGLLYYIGEHKSEMTCQEFVDFVGKHVPGKKRRVELAFDLATFI